MADYTCTVVICTHDRPEVLSRCLDAVLAHKRVADEVLVVDSAPKQSNAQAHVLQRGVQYVLEPMPGISRARNHAARVCTTDIVVYIDDDAVPEPGWLEPLLIEFSDPLVALTAGRVLPPESEMDTLPVCAWFGFIDLGEERRVFDRSVDHWYEKTNFGGVGMGANIALRRSILKNWPGFDERLGAGAPIHGAEELKAFYELIDLGYRIVYVPGALVRHAFPHTDEEIRSRALNALEASAAYITLLLMEAPAHRKATWRYVKKKLKRITPIYSRENGHSHLLLSGWRVAWARLKGVLRYFSLRLTANR